MSPTASSKRRRAEFGDFQTPETLARQICSLLSRKGFEPLSILEPTCGTGALLIAALAQFPTAQSALGLDINENYVRALKRTLSRTPHSPRTRVLCADFFKTDWQRILNTLPDPLLVVGNFPWVTNAALSSIGSANLPTKTNFQKHRGLDALTGKSNFDISEWMMIRVLEWLNGRQGAFALICKTAVARKILVHAWKGAFQIAEADLFSIDAAAHFGAAVDACVLVAKFSPGASTDQCSVYAGLEAHTPTTLIGYRSGHLIADVPLYERWKHLLGQGQRYQWRSGVKHDCSPILELKRQDGRYINGLGEEVHIEPTYLYPMLKSSEIANGELPSPTRWMLVTQHFIGEDTSAIKSKAPNTWHYLQKHANLLNRRGSSIYKNRPQFSVFGIGDYSFAPWKVAISGFYKKLNFKPIGSFNGKPIVLDDTSYFIACNSEHEAHYLADLLNSQPAKEFYGAFVFWDAKRPITVELLRRLDLVALAQELGSQRTIENYLPPDGATPRKRRSHSRQTALGLGT